MWIYTQTAGNATVGGHDGEVSEKAPLHLASVKSMLDKSDTEGVATSDQADEYEILRSR